MEKETEIYLVKYSRGSYDDYYEVNLFATNNEFTAKQYIDKFNTILKKWKNFLESMELRALRSENEEDFLDSHPITYRYHDIVGINEAGYERIKCR